MLEHCKFFYPENIKKNCKQVGRRITLGKIQFQCHLSIQLSVSLFMCNTNHRQDQLTLTERLVYLFKITRRKAIVYYVTRLRFCLSLVCFSIFACSMPNYGSMLFHARVILVVNHHFWWLTYKKWKIQFLGYTIFRTYFKNALIAWFFQTLPRLSNGLNY